MALTTISLLLSFGHYAPFYQLIYALPYFSTIRNPTKFLYLFSFGFAVLFAYGIDGLWRKYLKTSAADALAFRGGPAGWWKRAGQFDKNWVRACGLVWVAGLAAWYAYAQHRAQLVAYLQSAHLEQPAKQDPADIVAVTLLTIGFLLFSLNPIAVRLRRGQPWIQHRNARSLMIACITRYQRKTVVQRRCRNHQVRLRIRVSCLATVLN